MTNSTGRCERNLFVELSKTKASMIKDTKENVESELVYVLIKHCIREAHEQ
jgi:hypothetical protein